MARRCSAWLACSAINFKFRWLHILRLYVLACYRLLLESSENALVPILSDALAATLRLPLLSTEPATMALAVELTSDAKGGFLGKGGFGVVRRGVLKESGEPIAVKELDLAALQARCPLGGVPAARGGGDGAATARAHHPDVRLGA